MAPRRTVENLLQDGRLQKFFPRPLHPRHLGAQQLNGRKVTLHQLKIMNGGEDDDAFRPKEVQQIDQLHLPANIQVLRRLIQQEQLRFLRESQRNLSALALSPAQFVEDSLLQGGHIRKIQRSVDRYAIFT